MTITPIIFFTTTVSTLPMAIVASTVASVRNIPTAKERMERPLTLKSLRSKKSVT